MLRQNVATTLLAGLLFCAASCPAQAQDENLSKFMREKLTHSQKVLEGLTTENYALIAKHGKELKVLSQAEMWQVLQTPEYLAHSADFRRTAEAMVDAAEKKNLDGASLAYVEMTLKCVNCHKYIKRTKTAQVAPPEELKSLLAERKGGGQRAK